MIANCTARAPGALLWGIAMIALLLTAPARAGSSAPKACEPPPESNLTVDVRDKGAKGDGRSDDTSAIQAAIDAVGGTGGTVIVPDGTYMVDAAGAGRLRLKSRMTLKLSDGATLEAIPTKSKNYAVLTIADVSDVWVLGGTIEGERDQHRGKTGEWGMGITISDDARRITIGGVTAKKMWGDGFYVDGAEDVSFCRVTADGNRRQGLSVIKANGLLVLNSVFRNTHGTRPSAGIDLEPDNTSQEIVNVRVENSQFNNNDGGGVRVAGKRARISEVEMTHNSFSGNRPFVIKSAPGVAAAICGNRQIAVQHAPADFSAYGESTKVVALQSDCGETSFVIDRGTKKKEHPD